MESISAIGMFAASIYALLLYSRKEISFSDKILIVWMFLFFIHLVLPFMMAVGSDFFIQKVNGWDIGIYTLHLTFLYYYSLSLTENALKFKTKHLYLLLPTISIYIIQKSIDFNVELFTEIVDFYFSGSNKLFHLTGVVSLNLVFCIYFCRKIFLLFRLHHRNMQENYSFSEHVDLQWLTNLSTAALALTFIVFLYMIALLFGKLNEEWLNNLYFSSITLFILFLGYWGYKQTTIQIYIKEKNLPDTEPLNRDLTLELSDSAEEATLPLLELMKNKRPFLDPNLNIGTVANELDMHAHHLSKLLNSELNQNFFEFVNTYRVEEFKRLVADPKNQHYSILGLALDAGFNSKATFNRIFKNLTGQTPSQFRGKYNFS